MPTFFTKENRKTQMNKIPFIIIFVIVFCTCSKVDQKAIPKLTPSEKTFLELWEIFEEHYAFFELRNVNWKKEKETYIRTTNAIENDSILFNHLCSLLTKFDDSHINLESDSLMLYCNGGKKPNFFNEFPSNESFGLFLKARNETLAKVGINQILDSTSKIFQFGLSRNNEWGYLRIKRFYGASIQEINQELIEISTKLKSVKNLIIDVRTNPGGNDETALLCAGYYFKQKEIAFIKTARNGKRYEDFSSPDTTYIIPNSEIIVEPKNLYLLTIGASGSSAHVFALAMSYLPNLKTIGTNTEGIFSDMHRDTLSNGWRITLSNERYYSKEMKCYEKIGMPVDEKVENKMEDVVKGIDLVIMSVIEKKLDTQ